MNNERWLLPEGIEEVLPAQAETLESLRRRMLDTLHGWGYELVVPPFIEYLESLLTGTGNDLDLQTFKLTDQLSGRMMGVRADMTPQVARIDAHHLRRDAPTRLCYMGTVLTTRPDGHGGTRSPLQVGAELYGHAGIESDVEVLTLMVELLRLGGLETVHIDLGHVGIFRGLTAAAGLEPAVENELFDALQRKAEAEIELLLERAEVAGPHRERLLKLAELTGGFEVLEQAAALFAGAGDEVIGAVENLREIADTAQRLLPDVSLHFDLAELRGYHYHTGAVFAAYTPASGKAVAQGGRYDDIGRVFGNARPATGFSTDLKALIGLATEQSPAVRGIFAPEGTDPELARTVRELRARGERVVNGLPGQKGGAAEVGCDRVLANIDGRWQVQPLGAD